ncbi:hypothetical protein NDU88_005580 [Pleurodeles waltl]|uniref:Uncharacterized protein n=1 Tax=Pleurodeles waltl TaxID=8319 RepID=A0AAV7LPH6_PLEWA|nr:hypothetical protein NDU88_005580 [Pleurodeles waltl]
MGSEIGIGTVSLADTVHRASDKGEYKYAGANYSKPSINAVDRVVNISKLDYSKSGPRPALVLITLHQRRHEVTQGHRPPLGRIAVCFPVRQRSAWACSDRGLGEGGPKSLHSIAGYSVVSVSSERPRPVPSPHSVDPQHTFVVTHDTRESLSATASPPLQPRPAGSPPGAAQPLSSPRPMSSSRRTAAASPTQRSLTLDAAAPLLHAARTTFGAQPLLPPGFFPYPATPPFQFGRIGRDRRSGPDSAAGVSPGRHFVFRDGSGAARERGRFHEGARRRRFPGVQRIVKTTSSARFFFLYRADSTHR